VDPDQPLSALELSAADAAAQLGSFEWVGAVDWTVARQGDEARQVHAAERHRVRQSATGDFEVSADLDPGLGAGSETGKEIVFAGGRTYGRAKYAAFRERPTDRGRDAARFRDDSFTLARSLVRLFGGTLQAGAAGEVTVLGRAARRYALSLGQGTPAAPAPRPTGAPARDDDTARRSAFLEGRIPRTADGELVLDAATGVPLRVRIAGRFGVKGDPAVAASVELLAEVKAIGGAIAAIEAPKGALPDERKAQGVAAALEAAGLKRTDEKSGREEPADEGGE
jgi:hypothetical protein